jgi:hypothetical protein
MSIAPERDAFGRVNRRGDPRLNLCRLLCVGQGKAEE